MDDGIRKIDICGIDKQALLVELYRRARVLGLGALEARPPYLSWDDAEGLLAGCSYFDYLYGRVMKVDLNEDMMRCDLYDDDNGKGATEEAVTVARIVTIERRFIQRKRERIEEATLAAAKVTP